MIFPSDETNILSYVAIIKSLIRLNNDAKEIFKKGFEKNVTMQQCYENIYYISRSIARNALH